MRIDTVDPRDETTFRAWYDVLDATYVDDWPGDVGWQLEELRAEALDPHGHKRVELLAARDHAGRVVGSASLELPLADNTHQAEARISVLPGERHLGVGTALLRQLEDMASAAGRTSLVLAHEEPVRLAGSSPGRSFATGHDFSCAQVNLRRDLTLPISSGLLNALEAAIAPYTSGYRLTTWRDHCPPELLADRAELGRRMSTDAPTGELDWEEERWDGDRVRAEEALLLRQGRMRVATGVTEEATGRLVGVTEIAVPLGVARKAYQWDTVVLAEHRGHRLGLWLKLANLRALAEASPITTLISTWNADDNRHMIAVNEKLGFEVVGSMIAWQKKLTT